MSLKSQHFYRFADFELQPSRRALLRAGVKISIAPKTFEVLLCLVQSAGRVVLKEEILKTVWPESFVEESNLTQHIFWLRKALGDKADAIATIPGRGYEFVAPVQAIAQSSETSTGPGVSFTVRQSTEVTHVLVEESAVPVSVDSAEAAQLPHPANWKRLLFGWPALTAPGLVIVAAAFGLYRYHHRVVPGDHHEVVLADFQNATHEPGFDGVLTQALKIDLEQSPYMDVLGDRETVATLRMMGRTPNTAVTPDVAREICMRTNRQVLLAGTLSNIGGRYLVLLEATDCASGKKLAATKAEATSGAKVLEALDQAAEKLRSGLGESQQSVRDFQVPLAEATTPSLEALQNYSMGAALAAQGADATDIIPFFQKAIELDPQFAMAYSALGMRYYNKADQQLARENFAKALALSGHVSAREKLMIQSHYYSEGMNDIQRGIQNYKMWAEAYPHDYDPWFALANMYLQIGQNPAAVEAARHAFDIQPNRAASYSLLSWAYMRSNRFTEAKATANSGTQHGFDTAGMHWPQFFMAWREKDQAALARETKWADDNAGGWYGFFFPQNLAAAYALTGRLDQANELFAKAYQKAEAIQSHESADAVLEIQAEIQIDLGLNEAAAATVKRIRPQFADEPTLAILKTRLGDTAAGERYLAAHGNDTESNFHTLINIPQEKAFLALQQNRPQDAITALESTRPYELCSYDTIFLRAKAYQQANQPRMSILEYEKIFANPGIDPIEAPFAIYRLGLARAYASAGNRDASRAAYETFLHDWKDADPNIPVLKEARAEYAKLI